MEREQYQLKAKWAIKKLHGKEYVLRACPDKNEQQDRAPFKGEDYDNKKKEE